MKKSKPMTKVEQERLRQAVAGLMTWTVQSLLQLCKSSAGRILVVNVQPIPGDVGWLVIALEGPTGPVVKGRTISVEASVDGALEEHAHKNLGVHRGMKEAILTAEKYAAKWAKEAKSAKRCGCATIERRKKKAA